MTILNKNTFKVIWMPVIMFYVLGVLSCALVYEWTKKRALSFVSKNTYVQTLSDVGQDRLRAMTIDLEAKKKALLEQSFNLKYSEDEIRKREKNLMSREDEMLRRESLLRAESTHQQTIKSERLVKAARIYQHMDVSQASAIFEKMSDTDMIEILNHMDSRRAAKLLGYYAALSDEGFDKDYHLVRVTRWMELIRQ